ncbi:MAG: hypothetical protein QOE58_3066 [Actinomycetota bacterium]|jgi:hypothetical protein|nr:hypothetical protein [Actinomycetota bacterium]
MEQWRGPVNGILYSLIFTPVPDRARAVEVAAMIRAGRSLTGGPERYRSAIRAALAQAGSVGDGIPTDHDEATLRAFLRELDDVLGA